MTEQSTALATQGQQTPTCNTGSAEQKLAVLRNLPERLDDSLLARCKALADAPLRPLPPMPEADFAKRMAMLFTLPRRRGSDDLASKLKGSAYDLVLGGLPTPQIKLAHQRYVAEMNARTDDLGKMKRRIENGLIDQSDVDALPRWMVRDLVHWGMLVRCPDCQSVAVKVRRKPQYPFWLTDIEALALAAKYGAPVPDAPALSATSASERATESDAHE